MTAQERERWVEENLPLATHVARKYMRAIHRDHHDDLVQVARWALVRASKKWDDAHHSRSKMSTYAARAMSNQIQHYIQSAKSVVRPPYNTREKSSTYSFATQTMGSFAEHGRPQFLNGSRSADAATIRQKCTKRAEQEVMLEDESNKQQVALLLSVLTPEQRDVVRRFFGIACEKQTPFQIGRELGVCRTSIIARVHVALLKMKQYHEGLQRAKSHSAYAKPA